MNETIVTMPHANVACVQLKQVYNTVEECDMLISKIQEVYDLYIGTNGKFIFVFNTEYVNYCQPFLLKRFASWMSLKRDANEKHLICSFIIIKSTFTRTCFNAILKMFTPTKPYNIRKSVDDVNKELGEILRDSGCIN